MYFLKTKPQNNKKISLICRKKDVWIKKHEKKREFLIFKWVKVLHQCKLKLLDC